MSNETAIGWTDATFNSWWGCFKVSEGCKNCYAETFSKRTGHDIWGPPASSQRRFFADKHWQEPVKWNAAAQAAGERKRVFSASMSDVFEDHPDVGPHRERLFRLIEATPWLDWQLLTKRPENINRMIPERWHIQAPKNWWQGTSVENQAAADERLPHLLNTPAAVRFLSCEPLLGGLDLRRWLPIYSHSGKPCGIEKLDYHRFDSDVVSPISWVIVGGESGAKHRSMQLDWLTSIVDQCITANVAAFVKQDSGMYPGRQGRIPDDYMLKQFPESAALGPVS